MNNRPFGFLSSLILVLLLHPLAPAAAVASGVQSPAVGVSIVPPAGKAAPSEEDARFRRLYGEAKYPDIVKRYKSTDRVRKLSADNQSRLMQVMLPHHSAAFIKTMTPLLADDELANLALVAAIRAGRSMALDEIVARRLNRTKTGRVALALNAGSLPPAPYALVPLRDARLAVIQQFFFTEAAPDVRAATLESLMVLTTEAFKKNGFTPDVPPPPATFAPKSVTHFALKLAVLPYVENAESFMSSFDAVANGVDQKASR